MVGTDTLRTLRMMGDLLGYSIVEVDGNEKLTLVFPSKRELVIISGIVYGNDDRSVSKTELRFFMDLGDKDGKS